MQPYFPAVVRELTDFLGETRVVEIRKAPREKEVLRSLASELPAFVKDEERRANAVPRLNVANRIESPVGASRRLSALRTMKALTATKVRNVLESLARAVHVVGKAQGKRCAVRPPLLRRDVHALLLEQIHEMLRKDIGVRISREVPIAFIRGAS